MKYIFLIISFSIFLTGCSIRDIQNIDIKIKTDSPEIKKDITKDNILDLSGRGLKQIESTVFKQINLSELNVSNNKLTGSLPAEIRHLQKLQVLNAANNQMTGVPAEIGQLIDLIKLDLSNNQLTGLPYELGNLKKLKILNLSGNQISKQDLDIIRKNLSPGVNIIE